MTDLQRITGFSRDQLRDRLGLLGATLGDDRHSGKRGKILVGDKTLAALKRMVELERDGLGPQEAASQVTQELRSADGDGDSTLALGWQRLLQEKERQIEELRNDKRYLQEQLAQVLAQLEDLQRRALPPPRRRWWPWPGRARRSSP